jgi:hypothetical protein
MPKDENLFSPDPRSALTDYKYNLDIMTAQLRTRYYYARFTPYRPFVYRALHLLELMTTSDSDCCALAIKSVCLWQLAMAPPKDRGVTILTQTATSWHNTRTCCVGLLA